MKSTFKARIYQTGINWCVDVPKKVSNNLVRTKGYIPVKGTINDFPFAKSLVPVKGKPFRLFVNLVMMKGADASLGRIATFVIEQDEPSTAENYPMPKVLQLALRKNKMTDQFNRLSDYRKKEILKYFTFIKTKETLDRNIEKLIQQFKNNIQEVRIP